MNSGEPGWPRMRTFGPPGHADVTADVAVPINVFDQIFELYRAIVARHLSGRDAIPRVVVLALRQVLKSFVEPAAVPDHSALIRFGGGMRPSFTILSNIDGEMPMYAAASVRDRPRGSMG